MRNAAAAVAKTRKAGAPTPAPTNFINHDTHADSITGLRLQRLSDLCGLVGARAGFMEQKLPADWAGPAMWADMTQQAARLILSLRDRLTPAQLSVLMALGAMAHRQCKAEQQKGGGNA